MPQLPDVPTFGEFYPNTVLPSWNGFIAPARTPRAIVERIAQALAAAIRDPEIVNALSKLAVEPQVVAPGSSPRSLQTTARRFDAAISAAKLR